MIASEPPMPDRVLTTAVITEIVTDRTWRARLVNGKDILAYIRPRGSPRAFVIGETIHVSMNVQDFSRGEVKS